MKSKITIPKYCRGLRRRVKRLRKVVEKKLGKGLESYSAGALANRVDDAINNVERLGTRLEKEVKE